MELLWDEGDDLVPFTVWLWWAMRESTDRLLIELGKCLYGSEFDDYQYTYVMAGCVGTFGFGKAIMFGINVCNYSLFFKLHAFYHGRAS